MWLIKLKQDVKDILSRSCLFLRLRYSRFFLGLWLYFRPAVRREVNEQERYYRNMLRDLGPGEHMAFDIWANEGFVSAALLKMGMLVVALEPDWRNIRILEARFFKAPHFRLFPCAAGESAGFEKIYLQSKGTALSTLSRKWKGLVEKEGYRIQAAYGARDEGMVEVMPLDALINKFGVPSFIKIDVEGYAAQVMKGLSQKVPLLAFEANLPAFTAETLFCLERLNSIDSKALFTYASSFQLQLERPVPYEAFRDLLPAINHPCIDVLCIMSDYPDYFARMPAAI